MDIVEEEGKADKPIANIANILSSGGRHDGRAFQIGSHQIGGRTARLSVTGCATSPGAKVVVCIVCTLTGHIIFKHSSPPQAFYLPVALSLLER